MSAENLRRERVIKMIDAENGFVKEVDGYIFYAAKGGGIFSSTILRWIADELDKRNEEWDEQVNIGLSKHKVYEGVICRGCWAFGSACGHCEKCIDTKP